MCAMVHFHFSLSEGASVYMRVLIAAFRPKNVPQGLFRMFRLTLPVRAKALLIASASSYRVELWFMPSGQRTSGEDLRPELVLPGAARIGHFNEIRKAQPFVPRSVLPAQDI
jgi:hypothetical protein